MLIFNREPIKRLVEMGFKPDDCHYIDMYKDYMDMQIGGARKLGLLQSYLRNTISANGKCIASSSALKHAARWVQCNTFTILSNSGQE